MPQATDPLPEGLEVWDVGSPLEQVDWLGTLLASPVIVPGVTTRERLYGDSPGTDPQTLPFDLYLGIDCSGSMGDPAHHLSYPVLAGGDHRLVGLASRLASESGPVRRAGPDDLDRRLRARRSRSILRTLASYLGTGYSFGIHRLAETFTIATSRAARPVHILIVSDNDMFSMLDEKGNGRVGWDVARESLARCGGGGTFVLQLPQAMLDRELGPAQPTTTSPACSRMAGT